MTKIVYADPNIRPEVWTPPSGVMVLPISEHPAIVAESRVEKLPKEYKPRPLAERTSRIVDYLRTHPPTDANTIATALGIQWDSVKSLLLANPHLFRRVGTVQVGKAKRVLWELAETPPAAWCSECNLPADICRHEEPMEEGGESCQ